ncbi:transcription factor SPEECHLESS-like [Bidens hawaiensis]|uniref:transcription factor SPEECHLESS-like n=1 Tax=Bidens hawaiensis TaxID=980011 RepID=UPI0040498AA2
MAQKLTSLTDFFDGYIEQFADTTNFTSTGADDIFSTLEGEFTSMESRFHAKEAEHSSVSQKSHANLQQLVDPEVETQNSPKSKRQKLSPVEDCGGVSSDGQPKVSHITVERNRRKQMNEHLTVLRSLMPCFYVKRGDQASIIGGVVDYITELQQVLQSLEAKKQRKVYSDVLSPRPSPLSPRKPPLSPGPLLPISPRTPQPMSPYRPRFQPPLTSSYLQPSSMANLPSPSSSSSNSDFIVNNDLVANSKSSIADVEVKFLGSNLVLKTISPRLPGQATKIVSVLEDLSLEILQAGINTVDETMVNSFTIKIGIECQLSAEDLVQHIQQTFC